MNTKLFYIQNAIGSVVYSTRLSVQAFMNSAAHEMFCTAFCDSVLQFSSVGISYFPVIGAGWLSCWALWLVCGRNHHVRCCGVVQLYNRLSIISIELLVRKHPASGSNQWATSCVLQDSILSLSVIILRTALNKLSWFMNTEFWLGISLKRAFTDLYWF